MTTYYVGPGGNNGNSGLSYALRRLTLTSIETLLVAGDTVYVAPGTFRETLTTGIAGTSGNPITYIGDESGVNTDGVGGVVRITGSDNDQIAARANGISCGHNYRTFKGITFDTTITQGVLLANVTNSIIEQCSFLWNGTGITINGASQANNTIRKCVFICNTNAHIIFIHTSTINNTAQIVENCIGVGGLSYNVRVDRVGGVTARNLLSMGNASGCRVQTALAVGQTFTVNNSIFVGHNTALQATVTGELVEDYNTLFNNLAARSNVSVGTNSKAWTPLLTTPLLTLGMNTWIFGVLSPLSQVAVLAGTGVPTEDLFNTLRAATSSWGAIQYEAGKRPIDSGEPRGRRGD